MWQVNKLWTGAPDAVRANSHTQPHIGTPAVSKTPFYIHPLLIFILSFSNVS